MLLPRRSVAERAFDLSRDTALLDSYKAFQGENFTPGDIPTQSWFFSANPSLAGHVSRPARLPATAAAWNALGSQAKIVIGNLGGFDANTLTPNAAGLAKVKAGYDKWPDDRYAIFQGGGVSSSGALTPTNTCNIYVGEALYRDGIDSHDRNNKFFSAKDIYEGRAPNLVKVDRLDMGVGDIAAWGPHVEIITFVDPPNLHFCSVGGWRSDMGTPKCGDTSPAQSMTLPTLRVYRVRP